jgi:hypothetical protein
MITQNNANYAWERMKMKQKLMRNAECHSLGSKKDICEFAEELN